MIVESSSGFGSRSRAHAIPEAWVAAYRVKKRNELRLLNQQRYQNDPYRWCTERLNGHVYSRLREVWQSVVDNRRTAVPSAHETGKSWSAARIAAWWLDTHPPGEAFVLTTAPTAAQVRAVLWKEIRRAHREGKLEGRLNQTEWWLNDEIVGLGRKPADYDPTAFQGIHAKYVLVIIDEACGVPEDIVLAALSLVANEYGRILAVGNPDDPTAYFAKICQPNSGWNVIPISAYDTPNFTGEEVPQYVRDVLVSKRYAEELAHDVGEDSPIYKSKVLGQFSADTPNGVIPLSWIRKCQRESDDDADADVTDLYSPVELGVDVGAGGDETVIRARRGKRALSNWRYRTPDSTQAAGYVIQAIRETAAKRVKVDMIGVGWGVVGRLQEAVDNGDLPEDVEIIGVNVGRASTDPKRFAKLRDQLWWEIGRELSRSGGWDLRNVDDVTVAQLIAPTWKPDGSGRHQIEPKADTKKRIHRSPDDADALLLAFYTPPEVAIVASGGSTQRSKWRS